MLSRFPVRSGSLNALQCDFGLARNRNEVEGTMTGAQVGSMKWMAPEVMDPEQKSDGYAADRYAMGVRLRCGLLSVLAD